VKSVDQLRLHSAKEVVVVDDDDDDDDDKDRNTDGNKLLVLISCEMRGE
jgi:hypothetical protein